MKGDFTRWSFDPAKHYHSVLKQQGRVDLDADWNEQGAITTHRVETETLDVIGPWGAPVGDASFLLAPGSNGAKLTLGKGRTYVDGILCENEQDLVPLDAQPDFPGFKWPQVAGVYIAYLQVWLRHVTSLDDNHILEEALNGPDTCTRAKSVWQVNLLLAGKVGSDINCSTKISAWNDLIAPSTGTLQARAQPDPTQNGPCTIPARAGYRSLENQLYRVEIHDGGTLGSGGGVTIKWSRDNGSVVTAWTGQDGDVLTVTSVGRDSVLGFAAGQWVELTDDTRELNLQPGTLVQLKKVQGLTLTIDPTTAIPPGPIDFTKFPRKPKVRRWDSAGLISAKLGAWQDLENGVQVSFGVGTYAPGDYWLIPARTLTANVEWPLDGSNNPIAEPPKGIRRHYCRLAIVQFDGSTSSVAPLRFAVLEDCRQKYPPLTRLTHLHYVSGDGQEAKPGTTLPQPLQVGVANGSFPVAGAPIRFRVVAGTGVLQTNAGSGNDLVVQTRPDGVAECTWRLDQQNPSQRVEAVLISGDALPIRFNASFGDPDQEPGVRILGLFALNAQATRSPLRNDSSVLPASLLGGIDIDCDQAIDPGTVSRPTCFVTLELPFLIPNPTPASPSFTLVGNFAYQTLILQADVGATGSTITWRPSKMTVNLLPQVVSQILPGERGILAHVTLKGNFVRSSGDRPMYLDGDVFGVRPVGAGTTDLSLPSGDGRRGGTFQMWFWLIRPPS